MSWYPGAVKLELQPESDNQAAIRPTQLILHSIAAPWNEYRMYEFWRDSSNLESTFGLDYDGSMGQYIGTQTRADANAGANRRSDGTGAVSVETASNLKHTDPWTQAQIDALIRLGVWLHHEHGIPLRICRSADDPGYGYHRLFPQWSIGGTDCPGDARVRQFREKVFPGIVAAAQTGTQPPAPVPGSPDTPIPAPVYPEDDMHSYGPVLLMDGVTGDASSVTVPLPHGPCKVALVANYVPAGERIRIRLDEFNANGSTRQENVLWDLYNVQFGELSCVGPGSIAVQRLTHHGARVSFTVST